MTGIVETQHLGRQFGAGFVRFPVGVRETGRSRVDETRTGVRETGPHAKADQPPWTAFIGNMGWFFAEHDFMAVPDHPETALTVFSKLERIEQQGAVFERAGGSASVADHTSCGCAACRMDGGLTRRRRPGAITAAASPAGLTWWRQTEVRLTPVVLATAHLNGDPANNRLRKFASPMPALPSAA
jgi:hypothetical protein